MGNTTSSFDLNTPSSPRMAAIRRPDPPYLQKILSMIPPSTGDPEQDLAILRTICPPIDTDQLDRCRYGQCEHHSTENLIWGHLLKQQPDLLTAGLASANEISGLKAEVARLKEENDWLWLELQDARPDPDDPEPMTPDSGPVASSESESNGEGPDSNVIDGEVESQAYESAQEAVVHGDETQRAPSRTICPGVDDEDQNLDPALRAGGAAARQAIAFPEPPSTAGPALAAQQPPIEAYAVLYRYEAQVGEDTLELKGVFTTVTSANKAVFVAIRNGEFPFYEADEGHELEDRGISDNPWLVPNAADVPTRSYGDSGEVRYAMDAGDDGMAYLAVVKCDVDVVPTLLASKRDAPPDDMLPDADAAYKHPNHWDGCANSADADEEMTDEEGSAHGSERSSASTSSEAYWRPQGRIDDRDPPGRPAWLSCR